MSEVATAPRLEIGRVIRETLATIRRNFRSFGILVLLLGFLPTATTWAMQYSRDPGAAGFDPSRATVGLVVGLIHLVLLMVLQLTLMDAAIREQIEGSFAIPRSLRNAWGCFLPVLGLTILSGLGAGLALLLLIVPGIILGLAWSMVTPVRLVEGPGIGRSFRRSQELTRGHRWRIFLLVLILVGVALVTELPLVTPIIFERSHSGHGLPPITVLAIPLVETAYYLVQSVGVAVLYTELVGLQDRSAAAAQPA